MCPVINCCNENDDYVADEMVICLLCKNEDQPWVDNNNFLSLFSVMELNKQL